MTVLRRDPESISNYFDRLLRGIGHRGSSFTDVDAVTHDEATHRFLFQEFKQPTETLNRGQRRLLIDLARPDFITVWCVRKQLDGYLEWCDVGSRAHGVISVWEYQARYRRWWNREPIILRSQIPPDPPDETPLMSEIQW